MTARLALFALAFAASVATATNPMAVRLIDWM